MLIHRSLLFALFAAVSLFCLLSTAAAAASSDTSPTLYWITSGFLSDLGRDAVSALPLTSETAQWSVLSRISAFGLGVVYPSYDHQTAIFTDSGRYSSGVQIMDLQSGVISNLPIGGPPFIWDNTHQVGITIENGKNNNNCYMTLTKLIGQSTHVYNYQFPYCLYVTNSVQKIVYNPSERRVYWVEIVPLSPIPTPPCGGNSTQPLYPLFSFQMTQDYMNFTTPNPELITCVGFNGGLQYDGKNNRIVYLNGAGSNAAMYYVQLGDSKQAQQYYDSMTGRPIPQLLGKLYDDPNSGYMKYSLGIIPSPMDYNNGNDILMILGQCNWDNCNQGTTQLLDLTTGKILYHDDIPRNDVYGNFNGIGNNQILYMGYENADSNQLKVATIQFPNSADSLSQQSNITLTSSVLLSELDWRRAVIAPGLCSAIGHQEPFESPTHYNGFIWYLPLSNPLMAVGELYKTTSYILGIQYVPPTGNQATGGTVYWWEGVVFPSTLMMGTLTPQSSSGPVWTPPYALTNIQNVLNQTVIPSNNNPSVSLWYSKRTETLISTDGLFLFFFSLSSPSQVTSVNITLPHSNMSRFADNILTIADGRSPGEFWMLGNQYGQSPLIYVNISQEEYTNGKLNNPVNAQFIPWPTAANFTENTFSQIHSFVDHEAQTLTLVFYGMIEVTGPVYTMLYSATMKFGDEFNSERWVVTALPSNPSQFSDSSNGLVYQIADKLQC